MEINRRMKQFVVIGLGRFGKAVAKTLGSLGNEVLAIDTDAECVKEVEKYVSTAVVADATSTDVLRSLGVQNFDCAINCIGNDLQANILTTLICKDLGVNFVVSKAQNEQNKKVLERIGADMVIFPEVYVGHKIAKILTNPCINEIMNLNSSNVIAEMPLPEDWQNKTILDISVRKKYNLTIIFIKRNGEVVNPVAETTLLRGDILIIAGERNTLKELSFKSEEVLNSINDLFDETN